MELTTVGATDGAFDGAGVGEVVGLPVEATKMNIEIGSPIFYNLRKAIESKAFSYPRETY